MKLILSQVTKQFQDKTAIYPMDAELASGQLIGLVGKNGAGKSTLLKLLATIIKPTKGRILLDGRDIVKEPEAIRGLLGYLPQEVSVYPNLTAFEFLNYIGAMKGLKKKEAWRQIEKWLEEFNLLSVQDKRLGGFSGGMKQRVGLICALLGDPKVIIVDEPTASLDPQERIMARNVLSRLSRERIVLLSTHIVSDIEAAASRILVLKEGKLIFDGTPDCLIANVKGCVWEYMGTNMEKKGKGISNMIQTDQGIRIRQVSREKPAEQAVLVSGTLEDACYYVLGE